MYFLIGLLSLLNSSLYTEVLNRTLENTTEDSGMPYARHIFAHFLPQCPQAPSVLTVLSLSLLMKDQKISGSVYTTSGKIISMK